MYECLVTTLDGAGFPQYEISNFCRPGFESRHNLTYWRNEEYLAFGLSAHRYIDGVRSANHRAFARYMNDPSGAEFSEIIDGQTRIKEGIFLSLRTRAGLDLAAFESRYGVDVLSAFREVVDRHMAAGLLELDPGKRFLRLTHDGVLVSNMVMAEFM